jgi:hypothetical protein
MTSFWKFWNVSNQIGFSLTLIVRITGTCVTCVFEFCLISIRGVHKSSYMICLVEMNGKGNVGRAFIYTLRCGYNTRGLNMVSSRNILSLTWGVCNMGCPPWKNLSSHTLFYCNVRGHLKEQPFLLRSNPIILYHWFLC